MQTARDFLFAGLCTGTKDGTVIRISVTRTTPAVFA